MSVDRFIRNFLAWEPFFDATSKLPTSAPRGLPDKGKVFERLTQLYLQTEPEYQTKLRHVWLAKHEVPPDVRVKIGLPVADEGIDVVAQTFDGEFWAIQCKFRTETHRALTVGELATFANLSFNVCRNISLAVVAHTAAKPVHKRSLLPCTTEIGLDRWTALDEEGWKRIAEATREAPSRPKPRNPRPHQQAAIEAAREHFKDETKTRGRMIMPCGTGKSLTAFWIAQALDAKSILVAVPSLALIKQSLTDWTRESLAHGEVPDWLCVCSDETTGRLERDEFVGEVYELGVDATTDSSEIAEFFAARHDRRRIVFATYQSGNVLARAAKEAAFRFDLGIMDEAHRTVGSQEKAFAHLLKDENVQIKRRIFMTATERVIRGADDDVVSMDDPEVYGDRFYELSFKAAIEADPPIISDYKVVTITVADSHIRELIEANRYLVAHEDLGEREAQSLSAGIALQHAFNEQGVKHAISFHRSIRAADDFRDQHEKITSSDGGSGRPTCFHISSRKTTGERSQLLREFRESPRALITNARCLQEGVDIPAVDCVLFADPKQSVVDIVQAAGRAMRPHPGKKYGYVVVPIIVPDGMPFGDFAETTAFRQVARVITALSTQDGRIAEELRGVHDGRRRAGRIVEITGEVPVGYRISLDEFRQRVRLKVWERVGRANYRTFEDARAFVRSLGLRSAEEWNAFRRSSKRPADIPTNPHRTYRGRGWKRMGDWLGTGVVATKERRYRPFVRARAFVRSLKLKSSDQWFAYCKGGKLPPDIPRNARAVYRDKGWKDMGDWLGTGNIAVFNRRFRSFIRARAFARGLRLTSSAEWSALCKRKKLPKDIPTHPNLTYRESGWQGMGDWLGTGSLAPTQRQFRPFRDARTFARSLRLRSNREWDVYCRSGKLPKDVPSHPARTYQGKGWRDMGDWLGTGNVATKKKRFLSFHRARSFVRSLGLASSGAWHALCRSGKLPTDIPTNPHRTYRGRGWKGMGDWLGTGRAS